MNAVPPVEQLSPLLHLLRAGGAYGVLLLAFGALLALWAAVDLMFVRSRALLSLQALASLLPALLGFVGVYVSYCEFVEMAATPVPPKPAEFARVVTFAMACGIWGPLATVVPAALGVFALTRNRAALGCRT